MIFRELQLLNSLCLSLIAAFVLAMPMLSFMGYGLALDLNTRLSPNDSYLGTYYFWWTNLTYLPLFFFFILMITCYSSSLVRNAPHVLLVPLVLTAYSIELVDYLPLNTHDAASLYGSYGANTLLTNTLNSYHPFIFYVSTLLLTVALVTLVFGVHSPLRFSKSLSVCNHTHLLWWAVSANLIALWMGSWWALQEGTWGGWWNWDPSEMFGLLITFVSVLVTHSSASNHGVWNLLSKFLVLWLLILVSYFFIQLNFDLVSHNFGSKFFFFFNNNLFFLEALLVLSVASLMRTTTSLSRLIVTSLYVRRSQYPVRTRHSAPSFIPLLVALVWILWSYSPLVNYFLWNFLEINVFNFETSLQPANILGALTLVTWLYSTPSRLLIPLMFYDLLTLNWLWAACLTAATSLRIQVMHSTLLLLGLVNVTLFASDLIFWAAETPYDYSLIGSAIEVIATHTLGSDSCSWDSTCVRSTVTSRNSEEWNLFTFANSPAINYFSLPLSQNFFANFYNLGTLYVAPVLHLELPLLGSTNLLFWAIIYLLLRSRSGYTSQTPL